MQTVYTQCFLLHPVLVGWRVRRLHSFVQYCQIPHQTMPGKARVLTNWQSTKCKSCLAIRHLIPRRT
nr:MAG TPA_asm: hypothetical protein [Caudoviricetes sp.]